MSECRRLWQQLKQWSVHEQHEAGNAVAATDAAMPLLRQGVGLTSPWRFALRVLRLAWLKRLLPAAGTIASCWTSLIRMNALLWQILSHNSTRMERQSSNPRETQNVQIFFLGNRLRVLRVGYSEVLHAAIPSDDEYANGQFCNGWRIYFWLQFFIS